MQARERGIPQTEAPERRRRSSAGISEDHTAAARVLEWQRTRGNTAVTAMLSDRSVVQRAAEEQAGAAQSGPGRPARGNVAREQELSAKYGIRIGPRPGSGGPHFANALLDLIDKALSTLPAADLERNDYLEAIERDDSLEGSESLYRVRTASVKMTRPELIKRVRAPQRLWARMNRGVPWQRRLMDRAVIAGEGGITKQGDEELGIRSKDRHVMGGVSDKLAHGNLIEWTVRHEVGHAADLAASWKVNLASQERFGGWRTHNEGTLLRSMAEAVLAKAELNAVNPGGYTADVRELSGLLHHHGVRENVESRALDGFADRFRPHLSTSEFSRRSQVFTRFVHLALAQPWMLDKGGAPTLAVGGRIYHFSPDDQWVSYSAEAREHAVSNYQFASPGEWFAEAYAAYHDPAPGVRDRLDPEVQKWFAARESANAGT
jgi:hypothetical protein